MFSIMIPTAAQAVRPRLHCRMNLVIDALRAQGGAQHEAFLEVAHPKQVKEFMLNDGSRFFAYVQKGGDGRWYYHPADPWGRPVSTWKVLNTTDLKWIRNGTVAVTSTTAQQAGKAYQDVEKLRDVEDVYEYFRLRDVAAVPESFKNLNPEQELTALGLSRKNVQKKMDHWVFSTPFKEEVIFFRPDKNWFRALLETAPEKAKRTKGASSTYKVYLGVPPDQIGEILPYAIAQAYGRSYELKFATPPNAGRKDRMIFYFKDPSDAKAFAQTMEVEIKRRGYPSGQAPRLAGRIGEGSVSIGKDADFMTHSTQVAKAIQDAARTCPSGDHACIKKLFIEKYEIDPDTYLPLEFIRPKTER